MADVIRAVDGPLVSVYGLRPEAVSYNERADALQRVWIAARHSLRDVFEQVSVADLVAGTLPHGVARAHRGRGRLAAPLRPGPEKRGRSPQRAGYSPKASWAVTHSTNGRSVRQSSRTAWSSSGVWMIGSKP